MVSVELGVGETKKIAMLNDYRTQGYYLPEGNHKSITQEALLRISKDILFLCPYQEEVNQITNDIRKLNTTATHAYLVLNLFMFETKKKLFVFKETPPLPYVETLVNLYDPGNKCKLLKPTDDLDPQKFIIYRQPGKEFAHAFENISYQKKYTKILQKFWKACNSRSASILLANEYVAFYNKLLKQVERLVKTIPAEDLEAVQQSMTVKMAEGAIDSQGIAKTFIIPAVRQKFDEYLKEDKPETLTRLMLEYRFQYRFIDYPSYLTLQQKVSAAKSTTDFKLIQEEIRNMQPIDDIDVVKQEHKQSARQSVLDFGQGDTGFNFDQEFKDEDDEEVVDEMFKRLQESQQQQRGQQRPAFRPISANPFDLANRQAREEQGEEIEIPNLDAPISEFTELHGYYMERKKNVVDVHELVKQAKETGVVPYDLLTQDIIRYSIPSRDDMIRIANINTQFARSLINGEKNFVLYERFIETYAEGQQNQPNLQSDHEMEIEETVDKGFQSTTVGVTLPKTDNKKDQKAILEVESEDSLNESGSADAVFDESDADLRSANSTQIILF